MDVAGRVWAVPAPRMTAKRENRLPLSGRALEVLDAARALGDANPLVSPPGARRHSAATIMILSISALSVDSSFSPAG